MDFKFLIDIFLHLDKYLGFVIDKFGVFTYIILFLIIFAETGFVVTPFLPGDSILFAVGALSAVGQLNILTLYVVILAAAILGDTVNYWIGYRIGPKIFENDNKYIKKEYLNKTKSFYEKHGGKTIILARFIPIIRTFAPFVAGVGIMNYRKFIIYNIFGGTLWVTLFIFLGYFFGNIKFVKDNFELAIVAIIFISVVPVFFEIIKTKLEKTKTSS